MSDYLKKHSTKPTLRDVPTSFSEFRDIIVGRHKKEVVIFYPNHDETSSVPEGSISSQEKLEEVEERKGLEKYWAIITTGAGLFSDGYINNSISSVSSCFSKIYGKKYTQSRAIQNISSIVFVGTVVGQLTFGYLSDHYSRRISMLIGTSLLIVFTILCSGAWGVGTSGTEPGGLFAALTAWRFFLGIAIGSEYSSGSPAAAEASNLLPAHKRNRWFIWFTNFTIDFGFVVGAFVPLVLLWICDQKHLTPVWRISIGLGAIPPISLFFLRLRFKESKKFERTKFTKGLPYWRIIKFYWFRTTIVSIIWFLYDFSSYAFGTYSSIIIGLVLPADASLYKNFGWNVVLNLFYIPGSFIGAYSTDYFGARLTLGVGLVVQSAIGYGLAGGLEHLKTHIAGFVVMYGIFLTVGEFSAGNNVGVIASKVYATPVRGTLYGISAMVGKVGAFVGTWAFPTVIRRYGLKAPYYISSTLCIFSAFLAYFFLPDLDQDAMNREDERFHEYLRASGYDMTSLGCHVDVDGTNVDILADSDDSVMKKEDHDVEVVEH
ncbi:hypothetical protein DAKH74_005110 [Maudiozyma humilis]|uniref:Major facilitator superfamily (MFS) profile domain-containing protein n=1 Tax=Maudiozyma humilis TaxID=51915 RepID=A0AAV5RR36_MAUHU|nr:hypothetical protein DAKH74_005110 [Kazachstania humilis]